MALTIVSAIIPIVDIYYPFVVLLSITNLCTICTQKQHCMIKTILMIRENYQENSLYKSIVQLLKWF